MWPGFKSWTPCHMWVEFVVGSRPCSEGFSPGSPVFLPPQKSTFLNSNSIGNSRATGLSVLRLLCVTLVKQSRFINTVDNWHSKDKIQLHSAASVRFGSTTFAFNRKIGVNTCKASRDMVM